MMPLLKLSLRYLLSSRGSTLLVSLIAFLGIVLSVTALLLTMGVFAGFQQALREKILSASPHIVVSLVSQENREEYRNIISQKAGVEKVYYLMLYNGLISKDGRLTSVSVKALEPEEAQEIYGQRVKDGLLVGRGLADILGLHEGDEVMVLSPMGKRTPFGILPRVRVFKVEGIFQKGVFDQDYATVVMDIRTASDFFGEGYQLSGYEVYLKDPYRAQEVKRELEKSLGDMAIVRSWIDLNKPLFNALQLEKVGIFFVLMLMIVIASFNITSLLFMKVREKVRDIAVLRTFGLRRWQVAYVFLLQGLMLGISGAFLGLLLSLVGGYFINEYRLVRVPADVYLMDHVPVHFELSDIIFTILGAVVLSLLASLLPAYRAGRESIVRVLRNE
ncbi:MAG: ABC transporter permease [Aquificaceae bacterium]|jgi:lipoprotein-releasing system permease protein|uniref:FtsX-like permease family protein n=1 Tax=Hydrogenobacter sp. Uz 6-8 TaxID=3384828 RepID=UPI00309D94E7